jgi:hypothetical protein
MGVAGAVVCRREEGEMAEFLLGLASGVTVGVGIGRSFASGKREERTSCPRRERESWKVSEEWLTALAGYLMHRGSGFW